MINWLFLALVATFLWALVNIVDKYLVVNYSDDQRSTGSLVLFSSLAGVAAALLIGLFTPQVFSIAPLDKALLIFIGAFDICWIILYLLALKVEDVSAVVPWMLTIPVFGYLLGHIWLGETLTARQLSGGLIILFGSFVLSVDFKAVKLIFKRKVAAYMLLAGLIYAVNGVIFKFVASADSFWVASFWQYSGLGLGGLSLFALASKYRRDFLNNIKQSGLAIFSLNITSEFTTIAGNLLNNFALLLAPVALVYLVGAFQPLAVLLMTIICTKFFPSIVRESFSARVLIPKILAIGIMLAGSYLLFI
jgi:drug/metabolite transporter (DMT)-like permease